MSENAGKRQFRREMKVSVALFAATVAALLVLPAAQAFASGTFTLTIEGTGSGEVSSVGGLEGSGEFEGTPPIECSYDGATGTTSGICLSEQTAQEELEGISLHVTPAPGSEFVRWIFEEGIGLASCESGGSFLPTCLAGHFGEEGEATVVTAIFAKAAPQTHSLTISKTGTGSGTVAVECEEGGVFTTCAAPLTALPESTKVRVTAIADVGSELASLGGTGSAGGCSSSPCEFTLTADSTVTTEFQLETPISGSPLHVFVTGTGSVSAGSGTISGCKSAGGASCEGTYEGSVTLTETPGPDAVFAGWVGCRHTGASTCEVDVNSETDVYAVFLTEGAQGSPGAPGKGIVVGTATTAECPEGGVTVEVEGSGTKAPVCNGAKGANGTSGTNGANGAQGPQGLPGAMGATGPAGVKGDAGAVGPQGATGPQGPAGPKATVTCKVKQQGSGSKVKVTCTVKYPTGSAMSGSPRWVLLHAGEVVRSAAARGRHHLDLGALTPGRYVLRAGGRTTRLFVPRAG